MMMKGNWKKAIHVKTWGTKMEMIKVDYCGYHTHNRDSDVIFRPAGSSSYLFLIVLAPMKFYFEDGSMEKVKAGGCMFYTPGTFQHYEAEKNFFNSYIHFFCPKEMLLEYELCFNQIFYPEDVEDLNWLIKKIYQEYINGLACSQNMIELYVKQLIVHLHRQQLREEMPRDQKKSLFEDFLALRQQMIGTCHEPWNVEQLCNALHMGKSQFYKYYESFFHSSPKEELIQARVQKAKYLLSNDAVNIKQAAYESGFANICHFNRLFKVQCGCTPSEYKKGLLKES